MRTANVYDIFQNFASYGLVALALGITIIAGEFDLSVSSMYLLGGMVAVLTGAGSPLLGILAALGTAIIVGAVQGGLISGFRLNSMPVTLGGYLVVLGITYLLGHSKSVFYENYNGRPQARRAGPADLLDQEPRGRSGSSSSPRSCSGICASAGTSARSAATGGRRAWPASPVDRLLVGVFVISALGAALPGALLSYSLATASPTNIGFDVLTFSATAALIGGVSLSGGKGGAVGIAAGVLSLSVLQEILAILRSPDYVSSLITGGLLVLFTIVWAPELAQWFRTTRVTAVGRGRPNGRVPTSEGSAVTDAQQIRLDPDPLEPYLLSQGFRVGDLVIVSGQAALDEHGQLVGVGDFDAQAEQTFRNLSRVLEAGGSSLDRIVKVTIFLTDMTNFGKVVELRRRWFTPPYPADTIVEVSVTRASRARDRDRSDRRGG